MLIQKNTLLYARDEGDLDDSWGGSSWEWGRWILFAIFIVAIALLGLCMTRVNRRRYRMGRAPIRGTAWFTPPSYRQSQRDYNRASNTAEDYVPQYTATANEHDLGYYDENGEFHLNGKAEALAPLPAGTRENESISIHSLERPDNAVTREPHNSPGLDFDFDRDFRRGRPTTETLYASPTSNSSSVEVQRISTPERAKVAKN
ncbi:related to Protein RCR2 [Zygosaccharomyces bailii ISA1307]|nr:related to Protein RCR2 [Zygosaccharomyces bailii ISA1307]